MSTSGRLLRYWHTARTARAPEGERCYRGTGDKPPAGPRQLGASPPPLPHPGLTNWALPGRPCAGSSRGMEVGLSQRSPRGCPSPDVVGLSALGGGGPKMLSASPSVDDPSLT